MEWLYLFTLICVWVNSGSWWWTGRPGVLRFMGSQRVGHDWVTELNWTFFFFFKLYNIVLVLSNIEMNPPQVYLCSPSWTLLPPPSPYPPSGSSQCTSPKHPVSCIKPGLATRFIHDIIHVSMSLLFYPFPLAFSLIIRRLFSRLPSLHVSQWINCCVFINSSINDI